MKETLAKKIVFVAPSQIYDKISTILPLGTIDDAIAYCTGKQYLGLDIETSIKEGIQRRKFIGSIYTPGLDPYLSRVIMLQIGDENCVFVIDMRFIIPEDKEKLISFLSWNEQTTFVIHNAVFEGKQLLHAYGILLRKVIDTYAAEVIFTRGTYDKRGLADLAEKYLGMKKGLSTNNQPSLFDKPEEDNKHIVDKSTRNEFAFIGDNPFTYGQIIYGADDVVLSLRVMDAQKNNRHYPYPESCVKLESMFTQVIAWMELSGLKIDRQRWLDNANDNNRKAIAIAKELNTYYNTFTSDTTLLLCGKEVINWDSPKQAKAAFTKLGIEVPKSKDNEDTVGSKEIERILPLEYKAKLVEEWEGFIDISVEDKYEFIVGYIQYKVASKAYSSFGEKFIKNIHPLTGRIHSSFFQGTVTGRMSSSKPNMQNIPKDATYRGLFLPSDNWSYVDVDFSGQELRILAEVTQDKNFIDFFSGKNPEFGDDFHAYSATLMYRAMKNDPTFKVQPKVIDGKKNPLYTKEDDDMRSKSKGLTFKINYGGSSFTLGKDLGVEEEMAQTFIDAFYAGFPGVKAFHQKCKREVVENGYIVTNPKIDKRLYIPYFRDIQKLKADLEKVGAINAQKHRFTNFDKEERWSETTRSKFSKYMKLKSAMERESLNYPIQGTGADQLKLAMIGVWKELIEESISNGRIQEGSIFTKAHLVNLVHDEALFEVEDSLGEDIKARVERHMEKGAKFFCPSVPGKVEIKVSKAWGH